jgi:hypothetical protein
MSRTEALPPIPKSTPCAEPGYSDVVPLLIQVPSVHPAGRMLLSEPPSAVVLRFRRARRVRRRLRREVRVAGLALLAFLPLPLAAALAPWVSHPPGSLASSRVLLIATSPERGDLPLLDHRAGLWSSATETSSTSPVLLSIEPVGSAPDSDAESPVVFPGYLLPDDSHEELAHEGS